LVRPEWKVKDVVLSDETRGNAKLILRVKKTTSHHGAKRQRREMVNAASAWWTVPFSPEPSQFVSCRSEASS